MMSKVELFTLKDAPQDLCEVKLSFDGATAPFAADAAALPTGNRSFVILLKPGDSRPLMRAARTTASLGICQLRLEHKLESALEGFWFVTALYDGKRDLKVALDLDERQLGAVKTMLEVALPCRELADGAALTRTPAQFAQEALELCAQAAAKTGGSFTYRIIQRGESEFESLSGLKAVGAGSSVAPCLGVGTYLPEGAAEGVIPEVALCGKGITFDSGGYNLKPGKSMADMRTDKCGAVTMAGALALAIRQGLKVPVGIYLPCTENRVSGSSVVPGDVISYPNGLRVEIGNTDAEGRLILADALLKASKSGARVILDAATLTGAAKVALGRDMFALFARNQQPPKGLPEALTDCGELYWQLPLCDFHRRYIKCRRADLCNTSTIEDGAGAATAASFLAAFVPEDTAWAHLDLSSAYLPSATPFLAAGPTGAGIVGLACYLTQYRSEG